MKAKTKEELLKEEEEKQKDRDLINKIKRLGSLTPEQVNEVIYLYRKYINHNAPNPCNTCNGSGPHSIRTYWLNIININI